MAVDQHYKDEIQRLFLLYYDKLIVYARAATRSTDTAEEAVQEVFRIACQKPDELCDSEKPFGWLINTLKNVLSNSARSQITRTKGRQRQIRHFGDAAKVELELPVDLLYQDISGTKEFTLIKEIAVEGKANEELAVQYGVSMETFRKRVYRAKQVLKSRIKL